MSERTAAVLWLVAGVLAGAVASLVGPAAEYNAPWAVTLPAGAVAGVLVAALRRLPVDDPQAERPEPRPAPSVSAAFGDLASLQVTVKQDCRDADRFESRLRPRLTALVVERLWQRHRLDWRTDAGRAAALAVLRPALVDLLTAPPRSLRPTPQTLRHWMADLEDL